MPLEIKSIFNQLTDDAMKLMDGGDFIEVNDFDFDC